MTLMSEDDQLFLDLCDFIYKTPECDRREVTRASFLAAQFTANRRAQQRMLKANAKRLEERAQLKATTRASGEHTSDGAGGGCLQPAPGQGEA